MSAVLILPALAHSQSLNFNCTFEDESDTAGWIFVNGSQTNKWMIGSNTSATGTKSLYISDNDSTNTYTTSATSITYAYQEFALDSGTYVISYDWKAYGESSYDYLRVFLAPASASIAAGALPDGTTSTYSFLSTTPAGWIPLDDGSGLRNVSSWQHFNHEFYLSTTDTFKLVFMWCNDGSAGSNPPAAIDNIVFAQPTCPTPALAYIDNLTTTSFDLHWTDRSEGAAGMWLVEIDSANTAYGMGTVETASDTVISFSGLTPNTDYTLYINAVCGGYDTSMSLSITVHTPCTYMTSIPYSQDFESVPSGSSSSETFVNCWYRTTNGTPYYPYVASSTSYAHNGSRGLYWYNSDIEGLYQAIVLPGLDTEYVNLRSLQLSFWGKVTNTSYNAGFVIGVMDNPSAISTFVPIDSIQIHSTEWQKFYANFANYTGTGNFIAVKAIRGTWYACLDEFVLEPASVCPSVSNLAVNVTGTTGAQLSWEVQPGMAGTPASYQIQIDTVGATGALLSFTTADPNYIVTGLTPGIQYRARVRIHCTNDSLGAWDEILFTTHNLPCAVIDPTLTDTVVFSSGTNQVSGVPVNSSWGNTLCQSIYTAEELNTMGIYAGMISGLDYTFTANSSYAKLFSIYISSASRSSYSGTADMLPVRAEDLVYGPAAHPLNTSGTVHYTFTEPFAWDGSSNIVITTMMNQPNGASHSVSSFYGYSTSCSATRTIYHYQDATQFTPANCTGGNASTSAYRPTITIYTMGCMAPASCAAPTIMLDRVTVDTVEISWIPGFQENGWDLYYKEDTAADWTLEASSLATNHYTLTNILPMRNYLLRIVPDCGGDSVFAQAAFTTPCVPVTDLPFTEDFENFVASSTSGSPITDCWHRGTSYTYSSYPYLSTSYAHSGTHSMYFYNPSSSYYTYLALPAMDAPVDTLQLSFAAYITSSSYTLKAGVMTDPEDFSTFTSVATIAPAATNTWEMFEIPFNSYTGEGRYLAFASDDSYTYMYIDDVEVSIIPNCPRPREIAVSNVTQTNATISWSDTSNSFFEIEYGPTGFTRGTGISVTSSTNSVTLYGLTHSTSYDVYVRAFCTLSDTSNWSFVTTFATQCGIIDSLPYTQNFAGWGAGTGARPACWTSGGYSSYPYIQNVVDASSNVIGHTYNMYTYSSSRTYTSMPELDSISYPINIVQTVFRAWTSYTTSTSYSHNLLVGVCTVPGDLSTFTVVDTIVLTETPTDYEVAFDTITNGAKYITFVSAVTGSAYYNYAYLDSVAIELIPECQRPNNLYADNLLSNGATLHWTDRSSSPSWQVEYTLHGFDVGTGTRIVTTSNPLTVTGLQPSTTYDFYVRAICSVGDTSGWSRTPYTFSTMQNPATVPYFFDFETSTEWDNWQVTSNSPITWFRDTAAGNGTNGYNTTGTHAMYISADSGRTCSTHTNEVVNAVAYRDIDFGTIDSSYLLSFRASAGGCRVGSAVYDGLAVFMVDPNTPLNPNSSSPLVSPWGSVNDLTLLATIYVAPGWNTYTAYLDTLTGVHRLVFFWFNQNTTSLDITFIGAPAAVDDISIQYVECPRPANVRATNVSSASANIVWHGPEDADYRVTLRSPRGGILASDLVHTNSIRYTALSPGETYVASVRRLCNDNDSSQLPSCSFTTKLCNDGYADTIGDLSSTTTSSYIPVNNYYNYTYTQQIILASELSGAGEISSISFNYAYASAMTGKTACTIYVAHTNRSSFSSADNFISPDSMQIVYTGTLNCQQGWNKFSFDRPFNYDGHSNLVVAVDDNSRGYNNTSYVYYVSPTSAQMAIAYSSDTENPDCSNSTNLGAFGGAKGIYAYRNQMVVEVCPPSSCARPIVRNPIVRSSSVTIRWRNTGTSYEFGYRLLTSSSWITSNVSLTDTFYVLTSLRPNTDYVYRVRQHCDTNGVSNWVEGSFNSSDVPCLSPMNLAVSNITNKKAKFTWSPEENNIGYRLHVFNSYYDKVVTTYIASGQVSNLEANTRYYAAVQATCQSIEDPSEWSDTISFVTDVCPDVSNLTASDVQGNSAVIDWVEGGRAEEWEVQWGLEGFAAGTGSSITVDHHPYTITGLTGETSYDIYVRAKCDEGFLSEHWSNVVTITTLYSGINSVIDDARVRLFPNPTSSDVQITLPATFQAVRVEVIDAAGRTQLSYTLPAGTETARLATSQLGQGAYYVRITGGDLNTVKKLVVR